MTLISLHSLRKRVLASDDAARAMQIAGIVRFVLLFLQGIILVKAGVPLQIVGQIELVFFIANFFMFFWQNGANSAMMSWAQGTERGKVAGAIFTGMHIHALLAVCLMWVVAQFPVETRFELVTHGWSLAAILIYIFFTIPAGAINYAYLTSNKFYAIPWFAGISNLLQVALVTGSMIMGYSIQEMLWSLALFAFVKWVFVLISGRWFSSEKYSRTAMWAFVAFALPLIMHGFNSGLMDYVDGWIVSFFYGEENFALYRYGAREIPFNTLLVGGLMSGLVYRFSVDSAVDTKALKAETLRLMKLLFPLNCILILFSVPLYTLVYKEEFALSARIFNIYALTLLSRVIMNQVYCYVHHHNWILTWSAAVEVVINILLSIVLMQWLGIFGIPLGTILAYALQKIFLTWYVRRKFGVRPDEYIPVKQCICYFAVMILCVVTAELIYF